MPKKRSLIGQKNVSLIFYFGESNENCQLTFFWFNNPIQNAKNSDRIKNDEFNTFY